MGEKKCKHGECGYCGVTAHPWCFEPAPAPMLEDVKWAMRELNAYAAQNPRTPLSSMYATISAHISDLTRRLAKVEVAP